VLVRAEGEGRLAAFLIEEDGDSRRVRAEVDAGEREGHAATISHGGRIMRAARAARRVGPHVITLRELDSGE